MIFLNETQIDSGKNGFITASANDLTVFYTKGSNAHKAVLSAAASPPAVTAKGRYAYCIQAVPLGVNEIRLFPNGITII